MKRLGFFGGLIALSAMFMFLLGGCEYKDCNQYTLTAPTDVKFTTNGGISTPEVHVLIDNETGVEYLIIRQNYDYAITPRYNADGTLRTTGR